MNATPISQQGSELGGGITLDHFDEHFQGNMLIISKVYLILLRGIGVFKVWSKKSRAYETANR